MICHEESQNKELLKLFTVLCSVLLDLMIVAFCTYFNYQ